jgi:hypothetical protein
MDGCGLASSGSGRGQVASFYEHDNEISGAINCGVLIDYLRPLLASQERLFAVELIIPTFDYAEEA